jgi:hypothetical protein
MDCLCTHRSYIGVHSIRVGRRCQYPNTISPSVAYSHSLNRFHTKILNLTFYFSLRLIFAAVLSRLWNRNRLSLITVLISAIWLIIISPAIHIVIFTIGGRIVGEVFFEPEPDSPLNPGNAWIYRLLIAYVVLSAISFAVQLVVVIGSFFLYRTESSIAHVLQKEEKSPLLSSRAVTDTNITSTYFERLLSTRIVYWVTLAVFSLLVVVWIGLVIAGLADVVATFTQAYYCPPSDAGCYGDCDPTDPTECLFPFPSSHFLVVDRDMPTGYRVNIPERAVPRTRSGKSTPPYPKDSVPVRY